MLMFQTGDWMDGCRRLCYAMPIFKIELTAWQVVEIELRDETATSPRSRAR